jgi:hypothetical protein
MSFFRSRMQSIITKLLLVLACASLASCGMREDGFDWGRVVLFSAISGTLVKDGKPVAGATLTRRAKLGDWYEDTAVTDKDGKFSFGTMKAFSLTAHMLPHEPVVSQQMFAVVGEIKHDVWYHTKRGYEDNSELTYWSMHVSGLQKINATVNPIRVVCEFSAERQHAGGISSTCTFLPPVAKPAAMP